MKQPYEPPRILETRSAEMTPSDWTRVLEALRIYPVPKAARITVGRVLALRVEVEHDDADRELPFSDRGPKQENPQ